MPKYTDIEKERVYGRKYVTYDLKVMHPDIPDEMEPEYAWFKYWVNGLDGGASRRELYEKNLADHNYNNTNPAQLNFRTAERILQNKLIPAKASAKHIKNAEIIIDYFRKLTTVNDENDKTCKLMIYANGKINWEPLLTDINNAKTEKDITQILYTLTAEVRASALKGAFSFVYNAAKHMGKDPSKVIEEDKTHEAYILKVYNKVFYGDKDKTPIDISADPSKPFETINTIINTTNMVKDRTNLTPTQIYNELIAPIEVKLKSTKQMKK